MSTSEPDLRRLVALGCRVLGANGHDDYVWGHLSARDPGGRGLWMKGSGYGFEEISADEVLLVGWDGAVLDGSGTRHAEWPIHAEAMAARGDVGAVVHSHPPHAIALAAAAEPLRPVSHAGTLFVPPDVPCFDQTSDLIVTPQLGRDVAASLGDHRALLLVNHGIVVVGTSVPDAVVGAVLLEKAAHQQMLTQAFGGVKRWTGDEEALVKRGNVWSPAQRDQLWDYLVRRLPR